MIFSSTSFAYLSLFLTLGFLTFRFFQYWRTRKDTASEAFLLFGAAFSLFALVRTISAIFFSENVEFLIMSLVFCAFLQALTAAIVIFLIIKLKFPKISPWLGFYSVGILGLVSTFMSTRVNWQPMVESSGAINWGSPDAPYSFLRLAILMIAFIPLIVLLVQEFKSSEESLVRKKSLGLVSAIFLGVVVGIIDIVVIGLFKLDAVYRDYFMIAISFIIFLLILSTRQTEKV